MSILAIDITDRKKAEQALKESEQRFRDITENAAEWVWEVDPQGKYTYSSPVVEQLLGYKPEEILGKYFYDSFLPEEREELKNTALAAFAVKQPFQDLFNSNLHKDGRTVQLSTSGIPILDEQGNLLGYRGADIDITARKQAEAALAAHLQFLQLLLDTIPNPIFFKDAQGAYLGCNKAFEDFLGVTRQEIVGKSVYDLSPRGLADEYHRMDLEAFQTTGTQVYESRVQAADGARRHVVFHKATFPGPTGGVGGLVGIITDITGLKQAEAELRESEQRFRLMAETIQDVFWIATPDIDKMVYVSPAYEQVWGRHLPGVVSISPILSGEPSIRRIGSGSSLKLSRQGSKASPGATNTGLSSPTGRCAGFRTGASRSGTTRAGSSCLPGWPRISPSTRPWRSSFSRPRRWKRWAGWPGGWPTISTIS